MQLPKIGNKARRFFLMPRTGNLFQIQPFGYIDRIEIRWANPVPNMDAGNIHEFIVDRLPPGFEVSVVCWEVEN